MASVAAPVYGGYSGYGAGYGVSKVVTPAVASVAAPVYGGYGGYHGGYGGYGAYGGYGVSKVVSPLATLGMPFNKLFGNGHLYLVLFSLMKILICAIFPF